MTKEEFGQAILPIQCIFKPLDEVQLKSYKLLLDDIHPQTLELAVPLPAEIREMCSKVSRYIKDEQQLSPTDAWGLVEKSIGVGGGYEKSDSELGRMGLDYLKAHDEIAYQAARGLYRSLCKDPYDVQVSNKAYFIKEYKRLLEESKTTKAIAIAVDNVPAMKAAHGKMVLNHSNKIQQLCQGLAKGIPAEEG